MFFSLEDIFFDAYDHTLKNLKNPAAYAAKRDLPIMVWWTHFTGGNNIKRCSKGECYVTEARSFQTHPRTKLFLFYGTSFRADSLPLPRLGHHEWALLHEESPKNNPLFYHESTIKLFNHTATFRRTSDFPLVTQFLDSIDTLLSKPKYSLAQKNSYGLAPVAYIQSGCDPPSDRDVYVQELMKWIKVDSYGVCLHNKDLPDQFKDPLTMDDEGFHDIISKYKFTLSMENALCEDYITEKLWRTLMLGSVPIYYGSRTVNDWMPNNHSVILVQEFKSPKELADYIMWLDKHDNEYMKYLEYKTSGIDNKYLLNFMEKRPWGHGLEKVNFVSAFECFVCDRIHENLERKTKGLSQRMYLADQSHYGCPKPKMFDLGVPMEQERFYTRKIWGDEYEQGKSQSQALYNHVLGKVN
ncbi:predicted protein [Nematostella vectensis]|uniref:Fucosyltransferase n=1 Tax=Nematostella vectensis TaxID=45351 RepID=A7RFQ9_NEMVE|nr:predicted protein [Nematostella vectensis]|eukprot:XP_001641706.1 predicted protein [Nematostella vectensis]